MNMAEKGKALLLAIWQLKGKEEKKTWHASWKNLK